jgi:hypothetical protein
MKYEHLIKVVAIVFEEISISFLGPFEGPIFEIEHLYLPGTDQ